VRPITAAWSCPWPVMLMACSSASQAASYFLLAHRIHRSFDTLALLEAADVRLARTGRLLIAASNSCNSTRPLNTHRSRPLRRSPTHSPRSRLLWRGCTRTLWFVRCGAL
jgi:hypothetical protein